MKKIPILVLIILCLLLQTTACAGSDAAEGSFFAMDTVIDLKIFGDEKHLGACGNILSDLDDKLSVTKEKSAVYKLNVSGVSITETEIVELVKKAKELAETTQGAFDPTVYPLVDAWGFLTDSPDVPDDETKQAALEKVGYENIVVGDTVTVTNGAQIDLGGIAKGYATDKIRAYLQENGIRNALLNLGGNVYAMGKKKGSDWKVAIKDPQQNASYVGVLTLSDKAVVTSGAYERFFEKDGKKYGHIIDPFSGNPVENELLSVTIIGENATECDAFSTALFVMGKDRAIAFLRERRIDAVLVTTDAVFVTENVDNMLSLSTDYLSKKTVIRW